MVIAILLAETQGAEVHCFESDQRKCAFLREVARVLAVPIRIHAVRIEMLDSYALMPVDAVTSRALAPLPRLVEFAKVWLMQGAIGIFPRGQSEVEQLEFFSATCEFRVESFPSKLESDAPIVCIRGLSQAQT